jgi:UDP:flavonoid glycosyltransferase YjiC (YdhE family)
MGLSAADHAADAAQILDALADLDIDVVATMPEKPRRVPGNARIVPYVPLHALVPTCAAVIHHAGASTLATTALHAVPQLIVPGDFDGPTLAGLAAAQGAALVLPADEASGPRIRESVLRLLAEPSFRAAADRLRAEMHALPTPNALVGQLEELTTKYRVSR